MLGIVTRWGSKGYGFIRPDGTGIDAWFHSNFLHASGYVPREGDRVEFDLRTLPDGRYQAHRVRPHVAGALDGAAGAGASVVVSPHAPDGPPRRNPARVGQLGEALLRAGMVPSHEPPAATPGRTMPDPLVEAPDPSDPLESQRIEDRVSRLRTRADAEIARLDAELDETRRRILELEARANELVSRSAARRERASRDERRIIEEYLAGITTDLAGTLAGRREARRGLVPIREAAVRSAGDDVVVEYEEVRAHLRRLDGGERRLEDKAFAALERERRAVLPEYAEALDQFHSVPNPTVRFVLFPHSPEDGGAVLVAPLETNAPSADADDQVHVACAFWQAAERAAREIGSGDEAAPEYGAVGGCAAVRLPRCDAGLLEVLLDETWSDRPTLEATGLDLALEVVEGVEAPFEPEPEDEPPAESVPLDEATSGGHGIIGVARRLALSPRDLVVMLQNTGLPFHDDAITPGVEESLRILLGEIPAQAAGQTPEIVVEAVEPAAPVAPPRSAAHDVAARMLGKLLRDRRIGARHTRVEHAYGHHFADEEKALARRVAEYLEKEGFFIPKLNEGSHHVSVNPRRLREVGEILAGTWARSAEFDEL
jgi:cold shock CspA family protein